MEIREFYMEGSWLRVCLNDEGAHLYIIPDGDGGGGNCLAAGVRSREGLIQILTSIIKELEDLKFKVAYDSTEHVWNGLAEKNEDLKGDF